MSPRDFPSGGCPASTSWPGSIGALVWQLSEFRSRRIVARVENRPPSSQAPGLNKRSLSRGAHSRDTLAVSMLRCIF
jgi:hypothetical protein